MGEERDSYLTARERGDFDIAAAIAGEAAGLIRDIPTAKEIIDRMIVQANALVSGGWARGRF
jgi:nitronate monooxygenase